MKVYNYSNIFPASTILNTTRNSTAMQVANMFGYNIQIVFTGTPTGSFKLQASSDAFKNVNDNFPQVPTNWTDIAGSTQSVSAAGNIMWNVTDVFYNFVRVVYTDASSGASTAIITVSELNSKGV